jgi:hypothetical protein
MAQAEMADLGQSVEIAEVFHGKGNHKLSISQPLEYTIGNYGTRLLVIFMTETGCSDEGSLNPPYGVHRMACCGLWRQHAARVAMIILFNC